MNVIRLTVASRSAAAIIDEFHRAAYALRTAYEGMAKSSSDALENMDRGLMPTTIGGNQMQRLMVAQERYELTAGLLATTGLSREQIAELVAADAVSVRVEGEDD